MSLNEFFYFIYSIKIIGPTVFRILILLLFQVRKIFSGVSSFISDTVNSFIFSLFPSPSPSLPPSLPVDHAG